jgi:F0F1-type ATP synthase assembly protein I
MSKLSTARIASRGKGGSQTNTVSPQAAKQQFIAATLSMSWQLALVVLIPVVGGFKLDQHLKTTPALTITGFIVAIVGMAVVVRRALQAVTPAMNEESKKHD